jgi:hypothetical protein
MAGNDSFTKLLMHCDGTNGSTTFIDSSASAHTLTANVNTKISTASFKFGTACLYNLTQAAGDCVTSSTPSDFQPSGDFTIDFWFNRNGVAASATSYLCSLAAGGGATNAYWFQHLATTGLMGFEVILGGTNYLLSSMSGYLDSLWHHCAAVRAGNTYYLFVDGVLQATLTNSTSMTIPASPVFCVGSYMPNPSTPAWVWPGYIDEFRYSSIARWTQNFTLASAPYDSVTNYAHSYPPRRLLRR